MFSNEILSLTYRHLSRITCLLSLLACLTSCSLNQFIDHRPINGLAIQDSLSVSYPVDKVSYSPIDRTFLLLNRSTNSVRIYKNGSFFNEIGGAGFGSENFRRLADICVGVDGGFFALDSVDRVIKRFDKDGIYTNQFALNNIFSPERIAMTSFGSVFIYDSHSKEIFALDAFDFSVSFVFGKFQIDRADSFFIAGDFINIFDSEMVETSVFLINGLFENQFRSFTFFDTHKNLLSLSHVSLVASRVDRTLFSSNSRISSFNLERDYFIFHTIPYLEEYNESPPLPHSHAFWEGQNDGGQIKVFRGVYETR